ncbi:hypothetical protein BDF19DRAFT_11331 [Syncephalis fuscata]|nr:hypothetical protein BDF19DRAFT_11331 [Syncephalis fuscata]
MSDTLEPQADKFTNGLGAYRTPASSRDPVHPPLNHPATPSSTATSPVSNAAGRSIDKMDVSLRDILERYTHNDEILCLVLTAKIEEDKRHAAQANAKAEQAKLDCRRAELELLQRQKSPSGGNNTLPISRMARASSDYYLLRSNSSLSHSDGKRPSLAEHRNTLSSSYLNSHIAHNGSDNDAAYSRSHNASSPSSSAASLPATTAAAAAATTTATSSYMIPSFTDCLAFSPADMTHMPPLPLPNADKMEHRSTSLTEASARAISNNGGGNGIGSHNLSRSRSAYSNASKYATPYMNGHSSHNHNSSNSNSNNNIEKHSMDDSEICLTPTTLKRRQHEEAMRTVRERVLSKRRAMSMHDRPAPKMRASHDVLRTHHPRDRSPPNHQLANHSFVSMDNRNLTLPPLSTTQHALHRAT